MKAKRILPPTYLLLALSAMLSVHFITPISKLVPLPWNLLGLIPLILGVVLNLLADGALRQAGTTVKPFEESTALIVGSVYRVSRHPMYLGFVLILAGIATLLGSLSPWVILPLFTLLMEVVFIREEERMLAKKFGSAWQQYKKKVRRWM